MLERGAKAVLIRPAPVPGFRGPARSRWRSSTRSGEVVEQSGVLVVMHASDSGYTRYTSEWEGKSGRVPRLQADAVRPRLDMGTPADRGSPLRRCAATGAAPLPELKIALVENGSAWVRPILKSLADVYNKMPQELPGEPVDAFRRNIWVHPFHEEDPRGLVELLGADKVIFGSDYPHPEGMSDPALLRRRDRRPAPEDIAR